MSIEDESREEIEEALSHMSHTASRCFRVVGNEKWVTPWDKAHNRINDLLDARDRAAEPA
jgi:hypothetical protein